jgi:hypothetical protein
MSRKLLTLAALAAVLALPLSAANAKEDASDFGDKVKAFFSGAADDVTDAADKAEDKAKDGFAFFKDKADEAEDDIDVHFKAPWEKK